MTTGASGPDFRGLPLVSRTGPACPEAYTMLAAKMFSRSVRMTLRTYISLNNLSFIIFIMAGVIIISVAFTTLYTVLCMSRFAPESYNRPRLFLMTGKARCIMILFTCVGKSGSKQNR
jgi:hypothetical protein